MTKRTIKDEIAPLWAKVCAILLEKMDVHDVTLSLMEIAMTATHNKVIVVSHHDNGRTLRLRLVSVEEAERIKKESESDERY